MLVIIAEPSPPPADADDDGGAHDALEGIRAKADQARPRRRHEAHEKARRGSRPRRAQRFLRFAAHGFQKFGVQFRDGRSPGDAEGERPGNGTEAKRNDEHDREHQFGHGTHEGRDRSHGRSERAAARDRQRRRGAQQHCERQGARCDGDRFEERLAQKSGGRAEIRDGHRPLEASGSSGAAVPLPRRMTRSKRRASSG